MANVWQYSAMKGVSENMLRLLEGCMHGQIILHRNFTLNIERSDWKKKLSEFYTTYVYQTTAMALILHGHRWHYKNKVTIKLYI